MKPLLLILTWCISLQVSAQASIPGVSPAVRDSFQQHIDRAVRLNLRDSLAFYMGGLAYAYQKQEQSVKALEWYDQAIEAAKKSGDSTLIAGTIRNAAIIYTNQGVYDRALENLLQASVYFQKLYDDYGNPLDIPDLASCYSSIGDTYMQLEQEQLALEYFRDALAFYRISNDTFGIADVFNYIGNYYKTTRQYDSALFYLDSSLKVKKLLNDPGAETLLSIGEVYMEKHDLDQAESYFKRIVYNPSLGKKVSDKAAACYQLASLYARQQKFPLALQFTDQSIAYAHENTLKPLLLGNYQLKRQIYLTLKDYTSVVHYDSVCFRLKDEILDEQKHRAIAEVQIRYETDKKEQQLILLRRLKDAQNLWILMLIVVVVLFGVFMLVFRRGAIKQKRSNRQIRLLMRELNHRVKNNFQLLKSLLLIQKGKVNDPRLKEEIKAIEDRLQAMINIHKRLYQDGNVTSIDLKLYLEDLIKDLRHSYRYEEGLELHLELETVYLNIDQAIPLGLIVNEIISNAFKHAFKEINHPVLSIRMAMKDRKSFTITISDNGKGTLQEHDIIQGKSFGLKLIHLLSQQIHAQVTIQNQEGIRYQLTLFY